MQLFCLPFAGGSRASFNQLEYLLEPSIDVYTIEYPGRATRINEPFASSWENLMKDVKKQIIDQRIREVPFAILGYSMGTAIAYEMLQFRLDEKPIHAFLCARGCGGQFDVPGEIKSKEKFAEEIEQLGGMDEKITKNKRLLKYFIGPVYEDYKLLNQYYYKKDKGMPEVDFTILYCEKDTSYDMVRQWKHRTKGRVEYYEMGENHFFIHDCVHKMTNIICNTLLYEEGNI